MSAQLIAATAPAPRTMKLGPQPGLPRQLQLMRSGDGGFIAIVYPKTSTAKMLAYAAAKLSECTILEGDSVRDLWVGRASFEITKAEQERIVAQFEFAVRVGR